jgi:hypothetical protein
MSGRVPSSRRSPCPFETAVLDLVQTPLRAWRGLDVLHSRRQLGRLDKADFATCRFSRLRWSEHVSG